MNLTFASVKLGISEALQAEEQQETVEKCYYRYMCSLRDIFLLLIQDISIKSDTSQHFTNAEEHLKVLALAKHCLERATDHISVSSKIKMTSPQPHSLPSPSRCNRNSPTNSILSTPRSSQHSPETISRSNSVVSNTVVNQSTISPGINATSSICRTNSLLQQRPSTAIESPMEISMKENKKLTEAFQRKIQSNKFSALQLSQMRLTLQRKMSENLSIAKNKAPLFDKQMEQQICMHQNYIQEQRDKHHGLFKSQNLFDLYKSSAHFEFHFLTNDAWYQKCKAGRRAANSAELCFIYLLRLPSHPIREILKSLVNKCCEDLCAISSASSSTSVSSIGRCFMIELNNIARIFAVLLSGNDQSEVFLNLLSRYVFPGRLTVSIVEAITKENYNEIEFLNQQMNLPLEEQISISDIQEKFIFHADPAAYESPIQELCGFIKALTPTDKLSHINVALTSLVSYIGDRITDSVGADELLPVLCYVILRSKEPGILIHCRLLESFVLDEQIDGIEGYSLTTLIAAASYCSMQ